jgi:hypothetical protein
MGSVLHITSQLNTERTYLPPPAVFQKIELGQPVPLGRPGEQKWALANAITLVEKDDEGDPDDTRDHHRLSRSTPWP